MEIHQGQVYGKLTVLRSADKHVSGRSRFLCKCKCGVEKIVSSNSLKSGNTSSCGCMRREKLIEFNSRRVRYRVDEVGFSATATGRALRGVYVSMINRCSPGHKESKNYYDRGVRVCDEWSINNPKGFANFVDWALGDGGWAPGLQIDKEYKDQNNLLYCPDMCKFVSVSDNASRKRKQQKRNYIGTWQQSMSSGFRIEHKGQRISSGYIFATEEEAAIARDRYIIENNLPHTLNFPELRNEHQS